MGQFQCSADLSSHLHLVFGLKTAFYKLTDTCKCLLFDTQHDQIRLFFQQEGQNVLLLGMENSKLNVKIK